MGNDLRFLTCALTLLAVACGPTASVPEGGADDARTIDARLVVGGPDARPGVVDASLIVVDAAPTQNPGCDVGSCTLAGGTCVGAVCTISANPGNVPTGTQTALAAGGSADPAFRYLYPYDATVFPRGLRSPMIQLDGAAPDALYVQVTSPAFSYQGYFGASSPGRVTLSDAVWRALTLAAKAHDPVKVQITKTSGGKVSGPIVETWTIAQGSLRGTIYYETYDSQILGGANSVGIMKLQPGGSAPTPLASGCANVCHSASADGSTLVSATNGGSGVLGWGSVSYDLRSNLAVKRMMASQAFIYGGLYRDGSLLISATNFRDWSGLPSQLYNTASGANVAAPGWDGVIHNAAMPAFSPDGTKIAFNHEDSGAGKTLAVMDFAVATRTFSHLTDVATDTTYLGWPAFTPDSKTLVYHAGSNASFETDNGATGTLKAVDLATKTVVRLDLLDGYKAGAVYLPAADPQLDFAPTVLPEVVGGYFWVVFTSHRSYGNTLASKDHNGEYGKLWVAAIDLDGTPGVDPSHPAFYLDGQEQNADNLRGFWVLDPCEQNGATCDSGDECCTGFCRGGGDAGAMTCVPQPAGCANEYEACNIASDCCDPASSCIDGHCAMNIP